MEFFRRAAGQPPTLGVFPGTFNPVTVAHVALAQAALQVVEEVVFVLPRAFPHKTWAGASFEERVGLLLAALEGQSRFSIAASTGGLFVEIADECREAYGHNMRLSFLCGADAAERIANWDYGEPEAFARMMEKFDLLVVERGVTFAAPRCRQLPLTGDYAHISASEVRERIARGEAWEHLVPEEVREQVARIYRG
jgi:nicotinate (nicotinamide) nucleotide adenylyltransferase